MIPRHCEEKDIAAEKEPQGPEVEDSQSGKNAYWTGGHPSYPGTGQADQCGSPSSKAQDTGRLPPGRSEEKPRG